MALQATEGKYLLYDSQIGQAQEHSTLRERNPLWFWNDRLLLIQHENDDKHWRFTALDLITNETRSFYFSKSGSQFERVKVISLNKDYGFIIESVGNVFCVNLVKLEWSSQKFQLIEKLDQEHQFSGVLVNNLNPSKFVLRQGDGEDFIFQVCSLDSGKIELCGVYESNFYFEHYFNNKMFILSGDNRIITYDWTTTKEQTIELKRFTDGHVNDWRIEWVNDRVYASVYFYDAGKCGIAYTDLEIKRWISVDFVTDLRVSKLQYFDGTLIVYATNNTSEDDIYNEVHELIDSVYCSVFEVHSIPLRHPQKLRKLVWPLVVNTINDDEEGVTDPYKAASRYLPFNTDLRPKWSLDEIDLEKPASDKQDQDEQNVTKAIEASKDDGHAMTEDKASENTLDQEQVSANSSQESIEESVPSKRQKMD